MRGGRVLLAVVVATLMVAAAGSVLIRPLTASSPEAARSATAPMGTQKSFQTATLTRDEEQEFGVLQRFFTLPDGLSAEGLAIREESFFIGTFGFTATDGTILVLDEEGTITKTFTVPGLPLVGQLAFSDEDTLFAVAGNLATGSGAVVRVDLESGAVATVATGFKFPNGLVVDGEGNLFVTDLMAGTVSKVTPSGVVSVFASGPLLAPALLPQIGLSLGPNDLAFNARGTELFVTNVGQGIVVKVEVREDGTAGTVTNFAQVPTPDGVAFDVEGNLFVTSPFTNSIWIVAEDGSAHPITLDMTHESLNNPSNLAFRGHELFITNLAAMTGPSTISVVVLENRGLPLNPEGPNER